MAESYRFFNSTADDKRTYSAADMAEVFGTFFSNGVISGLEVEKASAGLTVSSGYAIINGYWYYLDAANMMSITSKTTAYTGMAVVRLDLSTRSIALAYKTNTTLTNSGNVYEIPLAQITVAANSTTAKSVTDKRVASKTMCKADISAAELLEKVLTVDGAESGIDSDMLDGQHGSYYRNYANLSNKPIHCGTAEPSSSVGNNGDIYIQY